MAKSHTQDPLHTTIPPAEGEDRGEATLDQYVLSHSDDEPEYLYRLWRATNIHMLHGRMASGRLQGRLLKMFVQMVRPRNIIEVGTFSGYSALCMAEGLAQMENGEWKMENGEWKMENGRGGLATHTSCLSPKVYTFEINDEQEPFTRKWIEESPWAQYVDFRIGDAAVEAQRLVPEPVEGFDMAFLDGDKRTYVETYEALMPLMNPGAIILADNTLWDGHVIDPDYDRDHQTQGIRRFNDHVKQDLRVTRVMLPLRDGLTIIRVNG